MSGVSNRRYTDSKVQGLRDLVYLSICFFGALLFVVDNKNAKAVSLALDGVDKVTKTILENVDEKARNHNGLIQIIMDKLSKVLTFGHLMSALAGAASMTVIYVGFIK